ncbi:AbrB family transcriptional regulator [Kaistia algarum]|uniref:AbrB/MazE/SpoVT family DNA-binding domain-containing protein n=1 Tax=Kaistia algarum TaxID=2083279 RepID=UPI000CE74B91|nr:AbrB/MazE/SpoVT family DNA-binding domain-containing protein [Kaistia algarum]MCX5516390.1 AbrB family transcriptional regulator [Kaistia algarum]PPE78697.1 AbrB family transcriptional regulator [Kaistia algarum]
MKLEIKKIGNSTGLILPKELLAKLDLKQGEWLNVTENADGSIRLSTYDPDFDKAMQIAERAMKTYRNALAELAK